MGNYDTRPVIFRQSLIDFPVQVTLGEEVPVWRLSRWASSGLRFLPPDDEGFTLRGDKRRLVYKGRRRSHRFTILGDTAFEYDCILNREPESNVVTLRMEGAENCSPQESFDFFRQPDFVKDPFLKGSYAVYKKETLIGEGTGKLCHIHRPEIRDSRGRRCWGDLSVTGNELRITIPENFLNEAKYPVIIDPTIGTTTVGSQYLWDNHEPDPDEPWVSLLFEGCIPVNRFLVSEAINGNCTAYAYTNEDDGGGGGRPVVYSDNGNKPLYRKSAQEGFIDFRINGSKPKGWRSGTFVSNGSIAAGSYIWFGIFTDFIWLPRFDYGARCYTDWWWDYGVETAVPDEYPLSNYYEDFKLSMYFTYTSAQNYVRTLTQGITLTDTRKPIGNYKRNATQTVMGTTALSRFAAFPRKCLETVYNTSILKALPTLIRSVIEHVRAVTDMYKSRGLLRNCNETIKAGSETQRSQGFYRKTQDNVRGTDITSFPVLFFRALPETLRLMDTKTQWGAYIRGLRTEAASRAEIRHGGDYYRKQADTVQAAGIPYRSLLIFVRLVTTSFVRDFLLRRFLKSNEELVLKSPVCREITLDSTIH
jgi:hypothetical protein